MTVVESMEQAMTAEAVRHQIRLLRETLQAAQLQLEYMESRWPTGTTPPTIAKIERVLRETIDA